MERRGRPKLDLAVLGDKEVNTTPSTFRRGCLRENRPYKREAVVAVPKEGSHVSV